MQHQVEAGPGAGILHAVVNLRDNRCIKAVIFDMDGLMLDTERVGLEAFRKAAADFGYSAAVHDVYIKTIGRTKADTKLIFAEAFGETFEFEELRTRWRQYNDEHFDVFGIPCKTGLRELISLVEKQALPIAVATSTRREQALSLLRRAGLLPHLKAIVGGEDVVHGKPHPEIFQVAARRLDVDPKECVVFEDSAAGIQGAHAAGMIPILIPDLAVLPEEVRQLACHIYASLAEACTLFT